MSERIAGNIYSVMWRRTANAPIQRGEYEAPSLADLLKILNRAENVSSLSCEEIVIHMHKGRETHEVYVHDSSTSVVKFDFTKHIPDDDALVAPRLNKRQKRQLRRQEEEAKRQERIKKATSRSQDVLLAGVATALTPPEKEKALTREQKPHIRLPVVQTEPPSVTAAHGLYRAYKA